MEYYQLFVNTHTYTHTKGNPAVSNNNDERGGHYAKWNKSDTERHKLYDLTDMEELYDLTDMWHLKNSNS